MRAGDTSFCCGLDPIGPPRRLQRRSASEVRCCHNEERRNFLIYSAAAALSPISFFARPDQTTAAAVVDESFLKLEERLRAKGLLTRPSVQPFPMEPAVANWMEGIWKVNSTMTSVNATSEVPEGYNLEREKAQIGKSLSYRVRFAPRRDGSGIAIDRAFNITSMTNAYAGSELISSVEWNPKGTRSVALFKANPAAKAVQLLNAVSTAQSEDRFIISELFRQIFVNATSMDPAKTSDYEVVTMYKKGNKPGTIEATQRVSIFLVPPPATGALDEVIEDPPTIVETPNAVVTTNFKMSLVRESSSV